MKTCAIADPHFQHEGVLQMSDRVFPTIDAHDDEVLENINSLVDRDDTLIIAGDFSWRAPDSYLERIRCRNIHIIIGNHDKPSIGRKVKVKSCADVGIWKMLCHDVFVSHYPHCYWPASHYGSLHIYGHLHDQREETMDLAFPGRRAIDCGVDTAFRLFGKYRPFIDKELVDILMARPGHDPVEFL